MIPTKHSILPSILLQTGELECHLDHGKPLVKFEGKTYKTLHGLFEGVPELQKLENIKNLAQAANCLYGGDEYQFIDDTVKFQEDYLNRVEFEQNTLDFLPSRIIEHGIFDVREMRPPRIVSSELVFYVQQKKTDMPYRVSIPYPVPSGKFPVHYELLPFTE